MPVICRFLGISVMMYYKDHNPPHFHVKYNQFRASFLINELTMMDGELPARIRALSLEWADLHRNELVENWNRSQSGDILLPIDPLI